MTRPTVTSLIRQAIGLVVSDVLEAAPAWTTLVHSIDHTTHILTQMEATLMALTQHEQQAVNDLSAAVETLATDLGQVQETATQAMADLRSQIDALSSQHNVDAQTIATLQSAVDSAEQDIVGALSPITQRVSGIDQDLKSPATLRKLREATAE